jgi:hypothetical protein
MLESLRGVVRAEQEGVEQPLELVHSDRDQPVWGRVDADPILTPWR